MLRRSATLTAEALPLPADVRLMNAGARLALGLAGLTVLLAALGWLARQPFFAFREIRIEGDVRRNSVATLRANAAPRLAGNYFTLDLKSARAAFQAVPWVRRAVVQRVWPNRLVVRLEEHKPVAIWRGDDDSERLVNQHGEVFDANVGDVDEDNLPEFAGDEKAAAEILAMYRRLLPAFRPLDVAPTRLALSDRGSWTVDLDNDAVVELGRGSEAELLGRVQRFVHTVTSVAARQRKTWVHADLRHADGYALQFAPPVAGSAGPAGFTPH
jgi:cell division protein FtsQ